MKKTFLLGIFISTVGCVAKSPHYVVFDTKISKQEQNVDVLKKPGKELCFPLSCEDKRDIKILEQKFDEEKNCAGLAAVQIGIGKKIIVFAANDPQIKKFRSDFTQSMPKTIWINASYKGIKSAGFHEDYEACFSVKEVAGLVKRFKKIYYKAYTIDGKLQEGIAEGYVARLIQHEIDHTNGILFVDIATNIMPIEEYRAMRAAKLKGR